MVGSSFLSQKTRKGVQMTNWIERIEFLNADNDMNGPSVGNARDGSLSLVAKAVENGWEEQRSLMICNGHNGVDYLSNIAQDRFDIYKPFQYAGIKREVWIHTVGLSEDDGYGVKKLTDGGFMKIGSFEWLDFCLAPRCCMMTLEGHSRVDHVYFDMLSAYYKVLDLAAAEDWMTKNGSPKVYAASTRADEIRSAMLTKYEYQKSVQIECR